MTPGPGHIGDALAEAARTMDGPHTVQETLDAVVRAAVKALPSFEHVGISVVHRNGKVETRAATDRLVWDLDALQNELNEGPCLEAIKDEDAPPPSSSSTWTGSGGGPATPYAPPGQA